MVEITFPQSIITFFLNVQDVFILVLIILWVAVFFVVQYYLLRFYYWIGVKFYQLYLAVSNEDIIHLLQHPSVSYNNLKKKYDENTSTTENAGDNDLDIKDNPKN